MAVAATRKRKPARVTQEELERFFDLKDELAALRSSIASRVLEGAAVEEGDYVAAPFDRTSPITAKHYRRWLVKALDAMLGKGKGEAATVKKENALTRTTKTAVAFRRS